MRHFAKWLQTHTINYYVIKRWDGPLLQNEFCLIRNWLEISRAWGPASKQRPCISSALIAMKKWIFTTYNHRYSCVYRKYLICNPSPLHCGLAGQVIPVSMNFCMRNSFWLLNWITSLLTSWKHVAGLSGSNLFFYQRLTTHDHCCLLYGCIFHVQFFFQITSRICILFLFPQAREEVSEMTCHLW